MCGGSPSLERQMVWGFTRVLGLERALSLSLSLSLSPLSLSLSHAHILSLSLSDVLELHTGAGARAGPGAPHRLARTRPHGGVTPFTHNPQPTSINFFFITVEPRVEWYTNLCAINTSPARNRFTILRSSCER